MTWTIYDEDIPYDSDIEYDGQDMAVVTTTNVDDLDFVAFTDFHRQRMYRIRKQREEQEQRAREQARPKSVLDPVASAPVATTPTVAELLRVVTLKAAPAPTELFRAPLPQARRSIRAPLPPMPPMPTAVVIRQVENALPEETAWSLDDEDWLAIVAALELEEAF